MSDHHLSRRDAARIVDAPAESDLPVGRALQALRAPGRPAELLHEDAAVAAFHSARLAPAPRASGAVSPATSRAAAVRAVAATGLVVALTSGGFALAATGHLPPLPSRSGQGSDGGTESVARHAAEPTATHTATRTASPADTATETPDASTSASVTPSASGTAVGTTAAAGTASEAATGPTEGTSPGATVRPTPHLEGLCRAYQAGDKSDHGKALDSAAFTALVTAAGGKGAIATYCVGLIGEPHASGGPTALPTPAAGTPTTHPTSRPTRTATGSPTATPASSGPPTDKPSDEPSTGSAPSAPAGTPSAVPSPTDHKPTDTGRPETTGRP